MALLLSMVLAVQPLSARECDQLTARDQYESALPDSLERLNQKTNLMLGQAVTEFNRRFAGASQKITPLDEDRYLALCIHNALARESRIMVPSEEEDIPYVVDFLYSVSKAGKGPLQDWLEDPESQGPYLKHMADNLYRDLYPAGFGDTNVIKVAGHLVGPDKIDHFLDQGYAYWRVSNYGRDDQRAIDYGVDSENGWYGIAVAGVFAYADLRANWKGYQFFKKLREYFSFDSRQMVTQIKQFDWKDWVDWQWDELLNPSAVTRDVMNRFLGYVDRLDAANGVTTYVQTCRVLLAAMDGGLLHQARTLEYLNDRIPLELPTYLDLVDVVAARYQVVQTGMPKKAQ